MTQVLTSKRPQRAAPGRGAGNGAQWIMVDLDAEALEPTLRHLGCLAERHGLTISVRHSTPPVIDGARVAVHVPRARTMQEAHRVVADLLDWIPTNTSTRGVPTRLL